MKDLDFLTLKILVRLIRIDYDLLLSELDDNGEVSPESRMLSDREYDKLHALCSVLNEIYKFRPLPF